MNKKIDSSKNFSHALNKNLNPDINENCLKRVPINSISRFIFLELQKLNFIFTESNVHQIFSDAVKLHINSKLYLTFSNDQKFYEKELLKYNKTLSNLEKKKLELESSIQNLSTKSRIEQKNIKRAFSSESDSKLSNNINDIENKLVNSNRTADDVKTELNQLIDTIDDASEKAKLLQLLARLCQFDKEIEPELKVNIINYSSVASVSAGASAFIDELKKNKSIWLRGSRDATLLPAKPIQNT